MPVVFVEVRLEPASHAARYAYCIERCILFFSLLTLPPLSLQLNSGQHAVVQASDSESTSRPISVALSSFDSRGAQLVLAHSKGSGVIAQVSPSAPTVVLPALPDASNFSLGLIGADAAAKATVTVMITGQAPKVTVATGPMPVSAGVSVSLKQASAVRKAPEAEAPAPAAPAAPAAAASGASAAAASGDKAQQKKAKKDAARSAAADAEVSVAAPAAAAPAAAAPAQEQKKVKEGKEAKPAKEQAAAPAPAAAAAAGASAEADKPEKQPKQPKEKPAPLRALLQQVQQRRCLVESLLVFGVALRIGNDAAARPEAHDAARMHQGADRDVGVHVAVVTDVTDGAAIHTAAVRL